MPVLSQAVLAAQRAQPAPQVPQWEATNPFYAGLLISSGDANFASTLPGVQDFCWEIWIKPYQWLNQPAPLVTWNLTNASTVAASNLGLGISPNIDGSNTIAFDAYLLGVQSTRIATLASSFWNTWIHVAMCRIGSTVNVYANGVLVGQSTGVTTNFDAATVGSNGMWNFTGPSGDRDESYVFALGCNWRNMRYTVGNNVYGNVSSFTPPPLTVDIAPVTGTQFIWWPDADTDLNFQNNPLTPDYESVAYDFLAFNGAATNVYPGTALYAYPSNLQIVPSSISVGGRGTWTNNGTAPNQPKITTTGPSPLYGNSIGDFTATGTNVRISSADSAMADMSGSFLLYIWFYVPATITNEKKTIIAVENTNGLVLNIGRTGQGLDWVSVSAFGGAELAYAPHIWARNAWNFLCVQKIWTGVPGPLSAWAGANGDNYAVNVNLVDDGASTFNFANSGNVSIGCTTGSTVSSQMYFNQILSFNSNGYQETAGIFDPNLANFPILEIPTNSYPGLTTGFDFQGTNGNTNIQPSNP
jgi:hypothetical protein